MDSTLKLILQSTAFCFALTIAAAPAVAQTAMGDTCVKHHEIDPLHCPNLADLVISETWGVRHVDGSATLSALVMNIGMATAPAGIDVAYYEVTEDSCSLITLLGVGATATDLKAGDIEAVSIVVNSFGYPDGLYIRACADDDGSWSSGTHGVGTVEECDDSNNCCCSPVTVICPPGGIKGYKYRDANRNGTRDVGEQGLEGWRILLEGSDGFTDEKLTGPGGFYSFNLLTAGVSYTVTEANEIGWVQVEPATGSHNVTFDCAEWVLDVNFGNVSCSTYGDFIPCPPRDAIAYWPFDDWNFLSFPGGNGIWGGYSKDLINGNTAIAQVQYSGVRATPGYDDGCLTFDGDDYMVVGDAPALNFGAETSFSLGGWVYLDSESPSTQFAMFNKGIMRNAWYDGGWAFHCNDRVPTLLVNDPAGPMSWELSGSFQIPWDTWTYVTVVVDRVSDKVRFYKCGLLMKTYDSAPEGDLTNGADLWFGKSGDDPWGENSRGKMDEFIIFDRALSGAEIARLCALYTDHCTDFQHVTSHLTYGPADAERIAYLTISNQSQWERDYEWSIAGLPAGPGCDVDGPVMFDPSTGTIPGLKSGETTTIEISITRPDGLADGLTSCFAVTVLEDVECSRLYGTLHGDDDYSSPSGPVHGLASYDPDLVDWEVASTGSSAVFDYRVVAAPVNADSGDGCLWLDGMPPGQPVTGSVSTPPGTATTISVQAELQTYRSLLTHELRLERDLGAGNYRVIATRLIVNSAGVATGVTTGDAAVEIAGVHPQSGGTRSAHIVGIAPTPFNALTTINFQLTRAGIAKLVVYAPSGRKIATLADNEFVAGRHSVRWNGTSDSGAPASSGVYFVRIESGKSTGVQRMVLIR